MGFGYGHTTWRAQSEARDDSGKRARTVFDNSMVAHVWAQQSQDFGRSNNGNFYFEGPTIFSYGPHFPIASFTDLRVGARRVVLFTEDSYSVTTSGHCGHAWDALQGRDDVVVIPVPSLRNVFISVAGAASCKVATLPADVLDSIREVLIRRIAGAEEGVERHKGEGYASDYYTRELAEARDTCTAFARAFKYRRKLPADRRAYLAEKAGRAKREAFDKRVNDARRVARDAAAPPTRKIRR